MQLELAENNNFPYTFVPVGDSGIFVPNEKIEEFLSRKKKKSTVKKIALSPGRNAFLGLVSLNVFGLASKLSKALEKNPGALKTQWEKKLGGNFDKLKKAISKGAGKKQLFEPLALEPVTATAAATAAPVLVSILAFLKKNLPEIAADAEQIYNTIKKSTGGTLPEDPANEAHADKYDKSEIMFSNIPTPVLIGGAALIAYLIFKKK